ncbi:MAG: cation transporter [Lachnospiraceae bacterium]|nr:cation transporter [Lachnospiraceae bacterium]
MNTYTAEKRNHDIIHAGIVILVVETLLFTFKFIIGHRIESIALESDAVNNLTDALYALITIITTWFAGKSPDRSHPYGYGRIEYLSVLSISILGLYLGLNMTSSVLSGFLKPEIPEYDLSAYIQIIAGLIVKAFLCIYMLAAGRKTQSPALKSFGEDAVLDILLSLGPLVSAYVFLRFHLYLELWISVIICFFILRAAAQTLVQTADALVGRRSDRQFLHDLKRTVMTVDGVEGVHDVSVHNYGKMQEFGSIHISVSGRLSARQVDEISREICHLVLEKHGFTIKTVGVYTVDGGNEVCTRMEEEIRTFLEGYDDVLQVHGLLVDADRKDINADVVIDYAALRRQMVYDEIEMRLKEKYPEYRVYITRDAS